MHHPIRRFALTFLLFAVWPLLLFAQHVPGTKWLQKETEAFRIIYPPSLSNDAAALAMALDAVLEDASSGLPVVHPKKKWPLVLTDHGLEANGFVGLVPRRSVWYAAPGEDFSAVSDWWMLLARHEARHMAQYDAADQGFTHFIRVLFGEYGWGAGIVLGSPSWLLEGDAVVMETVLSEEGRGRDGLFTRELPALLAEWPDMDYRHAANPSFRKHIPDHYHLGYALASWIRREYGSDALEEIYRSSARIPIPVIGINIGTKRSTGKRPNDLFEEMAAELRRLASERDMATDWTAVDIVSPEHRTYANYDSVFDAGSLGLFARRERLDDPARLVRIDGDGLEQEWMRLPSEGRVSMARFGGSSDGEEGLRVAWNAVRPHPVYLGAGVSDLTVVTLDARGRVRSRTQPITGTRYQYPVLSPDGERLAAVHLNRGLGCRIDILDAVTGTVIQSRAFEDETAAYPSWSPDGRRLVFTLRNDAGRRIAEWSPDSTDVIERTARSRETVKQPVFSADGKSIFYSSNGPEQNEMEAIRAVGSFGTDSVVLARRPWGITSPVASRDGSGIFALDYGGGRGDVVMKLPVPPIHETVQGAVSPFLVQASAGIIGEEISEAPARDEAIRNPDHRDAVIQESQERYPESPYFPAAHGLNIHSWGLAPLGSELRFFTRSDDVLGTAGVEVGGLYEISEGSPGAYALWEYRGSRPVFGIRADYRYRSPKDDPFHLTSLGARAAVPMNLSRSGIWEHSLEFGIEGGGLWSQPAGPGSNRASEALPYLSYDADWQRIRPGSDRSFRPDLGWTLSAGYAHVPLPGDTQDSSSLALDLYLPGAFRNASLRLGGRGERRPDLFAPRIIPPRGYDSEDSGTTLVASVDYEFPLAYPDWPVGSALFIQRFRMGLFTDFGFGGAEDAIEKGGPWERQWSSGVTLTMDFSAFNNFPGFNMGVRFNWLWQEERARVDVMVMELALF